jgi:hypothetical protein
MYSQQNEQIRLSIFDRLVSKFSGYLVTADTAAQEFKKGMTPAAVRTAISRKKFPVKTEKIMGTHMVRLVDLAEFLCAVSTPSIAVDESHAVPVLSTENKRRRGQRGPGKRRAEYMERI